MAGLTVAVMGVPQAMAYATIADLPPVYGLYTAIVSCIVGALLGSSRHLVTGPTNASCMVILSLTAPLHAKYGRDPFEIILLLTLMTGVIQIGLRAAPLRRDRALRVQLGGGRVHRRRRHLDRGEPAAADAGLRARSQPRPVLRSRLGNAAAPARNQPVRADDRPRDRGAADRVAEGRPAAAGGGDRSRLDGDAVLAAGLGCLGHGQRRGADRPRHRADRRQPADLPRPRAAGAAQLRPHPRARHGRAGPGDPRLRRGRFDLPRGRRVVRPAAGLHPRVPRPRRLQGGRRLLLELRQLRLLHPDGGLLQVRRAHSHGSGVLGGLDRARPGRLGADRQPHPAGGSRRPAGRHRLLDDRQGAPAADAALGTAVPHGGRRHAVVDAGPADSSSRSSSACRCRC